MKASFTDKLIQANLLRADKGLHRNRKLLPATNRYNFSSNDYLSLTSDSKVKGFYQEGYTKYPTGSTGSVVISGFSQAHADLEKHIAACLQVDSCLLFTSGYAANLSVMSLLASNGSKVLLDKAAHASIYDGIRLSGADYTRYLHNDLKSLQSKLNNYTNEQDYLAVITESIFSMSGQIADLASINKLVAKKNTNLIVDEAHAFGVVGKAGMGGVVAADLTQDEVPLRIIPLGKACAGFGAIVAGHAAWIEALLQTRPIVYSTAISPAATYGLLKTIEYIQELDARRNKLQELIRYFKTKVTDSHLTWRDSDTQIQQLQLGCPHLAVTVAEDLVKASITCLPIREPTVRKHETGLRVIINYAHEPEHIDYLFTCLSEILA